MHADLLINPDKREHQRIDDFGKRYSDEYEDDVGKAIFWYTRKHEIQ